MRSVKGSRRINVHGIEYRWRATGNDGYISIGIWPINNLGPFIYGTFRYHESPADKSLGIVITNRIIRRVLEYAIAKYNYDPAFKGTELNLKNLDDVILIEDALRVTDYRTQQLGNT